MSGKFVVFPWTRPFLPAFARFLNERGHGTLDIPLLVSPTYRPWNYLQNELSSMREARVLPRLATLKEIVDLWHKDVNRNAPAEASSLDMAALVHEAARKVALEEAELDGGASPADDGFGQGRSAFPSMDLDAFFPWAEKLADLMDEMLTNNVLPEDVLACDDEVLPEAARLLESLGQIGENYLEALRSHNLATTGLAHYEVAQTLDGSLPDFVRPRPGQPVYVMGFHTLDGTREAIVRRLWEAGAVICLHSDPKIVDPETRARAHWLCQRHAQWLEEWGAEAELCEAWAGGPAASTGSPDDVAEDDARVTFLSGHDLHSQLGELKKSLENIDLEKRSCVLLPKASLLMPVLHHVPERLRPHLNIAMGLSVTDSPLYQLIRDLLLLQTDRDDAGRYHWKKLLACVDSPLLAGLSGPGGESVLGAVRRFRTQLLRGRRYVDPWNDVLRAEVFDGVPQEAEIMADLLDVLVRPFVDTPTPEALASALQRLCDHVNGRGTSLRTTSPIDMEALFHIEHVFLPELRCTLLRSSQLGRHVLLRIFDDFCRREHMFFESTQANAPDSAGRRRNPAEAPLQIMNVLESTLLSFDQVFILEATDDTLPGPKRHDPLLPDSLRAVLGLPALDNDETETGYNILRLCKSSRVKHFFWQEGISRSSLFDGKKSRSRFVEEYIWQLEQKEKRIFEKGEEPLRVVRSRLVPMQPVPRIFRIAGEMREAMDEILSTNLSPSSMDKYLTCPLRFGFHRLGRLRPLEMVNEGDDPTGIGTVLHEALEIFHTRHLGETLGDDPEVREQAAEELVKVFEEVMKAPKNQLPHTLPPASLAMLESLAPDKLRQYVRAQPADSCPVLLEHVIAAKIPVAGGTVALEGRIDRMDSRDRGLVVLDYKSGSEIPNVDHKLWEKVEFFAQARRVTETGTLDAVDKRLVHELFGQLRDFTTSIQLPCYVTICRDKNRILKDPEDNRVREWPDGELANAVFVGLADKGEEISFCDVKKLDPMEVMDRCAVIVRLVAAHMMLADNFVQLRDNKRCSWCDFRTLCHS